MSPEQKQIAFDRAMARFLEARGHAALAREHLRSAEMLEAWLASGRRESAPLPRPRREPALPRTGTYVSKHPLAGRRP